MNIHTILVPTDFSEYSDKAFSWALDMAEKWEAKLELLHVVPTPNYPPMMIADGGFNPADYESSLIADAESLLGLGQAVWICGGAECSRCLALQQKVLGASFSPLFAKRRK